MSGKNRVNPVNLRARRHGAQERLTKRIEFLKSQDDIESQVKLEVAKIDFYNLNAKLTQWR